MNIENIKFSDLERKYWGIKLLKKDKEALLLFQQCLELKNKKLNCYQISKKLTLSKHTVAKWSRLESIPYAARLCYYALDNPSHDCSWLSLNSTRGGIFTGPWIKVPNKIESFNEILDVLKQLQPLPETQNLAKKFGIIKDVKNAKPLLFAYLLGIILGDASKDKIIRVQRVTRRLQLRLTKFHSENENIGEFVSLCIKSLGLRINKGKDMRPGSHNKYPFYAWHSQSSAFLAWVFNVCLGLNNNEVTTYHKIRANWLIGTPEKFRIWFLQGLADSDGYIDFNSFRAGIVSQPNSELISKLLNSLKTKNSTIVFKKKNIEAVVISIEDANKLPLFNSFVKSHRYNYMVKLAKAKKLEWHMSEDLENKIKNHMSSGLYGSALIRKIIDEENIRVRPKALRRIKLKMESDKTVR